MRTRDALALAVAALPLVAATPPAGEQDRVRWQGAMHNIAVYRPATAGSGSPLLLAIGDPGRNAAYALDSWRDVADSEGFVVAAVSSKRPDAWTVAQDGPGLLRAVVQQVRSRHGIDTRRVYLFGAGVGGGFALSVATMQPRYFAAVASFGGDPRISDLSRREPLERKLPMSIFYSKRMPQFDVEALEQAAAALADLGAEVEVSRLDVGPDFERKGRKVAGRIWRALSPQALAEGPRYEPTPFDR